MPLENNIGTSSLPDELNPEWPLGSDAKSEGDDHIRNLKRVVVNFYNNMNFSTLTNGAIAATFDGVRDESGMRVIGGGIDVGVPVDFEAAFVRDLVAGGENFAPIVFSPIGTNSKPYHLKTSAFGPIDGQMVDTEQNALVAGVAVPVLTAMLTKTLTVRSASTVTNARITIREDNVNGKVLVKTATDQELRTGGGFTLNGTGDTVVTLQQYWPSIPGDTVHIIFERYDSVSGLITSQGFLFKGATISGQFVPYFNRSGYRYTLTPLREAALTKAELNFSTPIVINTTLLEGSDLPVVSGKNIRYKLYMLAKSSGGQDAHMDVGLTINGVALNRDGAGYLGQAYIALNGQAVPFVFEGKYTPTTTGDVSYVVNATVRARSIEVLNAFIEFWVE